MELDVKNQNLEEQVEVQKILLEFLEEFLNAKYEELPDIVHGSLQFIGETIHALALNGYLIHTFSHIEAYKWQKDNILFSELKIDEAFLNDIEEGSYIEENGMLRILLPMKSFGKIIGIMEVIIDADYKLDSGFEEIIFQIAEMYKGVFKKVVDYMSEQDDEVEKFRHLSYHDRLTGVYNRLYFEEKLSDIDIEKNYPISIIMGDVNGLKLLNNIFGKKMGDEVLIEASMILTQAIGQDGIISRVRGNEFIVLLMNKTSDEALYYVKKMKENIVTMSYLPVDLSISFGFATKDDDEKSLSDVIKMAEDKMRAQKIKETKEARLLIIKRAEDALMNSTHETKMHIESLKTLAIEIGRRMNLKEDQLKELELLALAHDIGILMMPKYIFNKEGALTHEEWRIIKTHVEIGYKIAIEVMEYKNIAESILYHHERWDGKGYPQGLAGEEIPLMARIISIVDAYNVMITGRHYNTVRTKEEAIIEIELNSGTQFDPRIVEIFLDAVKG